MTLSQAVSTLRDGGPLTSLAEAVGVVASDTHSTDAELLLALRHPGFVAERAALALHRRTGAPLEGNPARCITSENRWRTLLKPRRTSPAARIRRTG